MYAITGVTGQVGGAVVDALLKQDRSVRAIVRDAGKGAAFKARGCAVALADMTNQAELVEAFSHADGVFIVIPPVFDPAPGFPDSKRIFATLHAAIEEARPGKVVFLSTIGAQATQPNLLNVLGIMERTMSDLSVPVAFLRAGWFMENALWDVPAARDEGVLRSFLQPLDQRYPMVATHDIGVVGAELLQETWSGVRVVELEGPHRVTPDDIAAAFTQALGHDVHAQVVARDTWETLFRSQGMKNPLPRMQMVDGFNEGWIEFEHAGEVRKGTTRIATVLRELVKR
jgi:NAD(P)H dehydrogenase (quinone)